ncbi:MAG: uracil-DNA glycosylase family protein [Planctomycetia bacterium]|nr:uracil-DNA glycosylase family protein [Planctomycetia bacterium]
MKFFYPNKQNDFWRIMGYIFEGNKDFFLFRDEKNEKRQLKRSQGNHQETFYDLPKIKKFLRKKKIGLSDMGQEVIRRKQNASDAFLQITIPLNLTGILDEIPSCMMVAAAGEKAAEMAGNFLGVVPPEVGKWVDFLFHNRRMMFARLPSSSRAYPLPLEQKAEMYRKIFEQADLMSDER